MGVAVVQLSNQVHLFATLWIAHQASLSLTISWSLLKFTSIELVMPSNHLILCRPLVLLPSIFPSIRVFSDESAVHIRWPKYWSFSFSISHSNEYSGGLISLSLSAGNVSPKGNQPQVLNGRTDTEAETPILWPPDVNS